MKNHLPPSPILCRFATDGRIWTPTEVFNWVARESNKYRRRAFGGKLAFSIVESANGLILAVEDDGLSRGAMSICYGAEVSLVAETPIVPGIVDALHIAGMLIHAVGGKLDSLAWLLGDTNPLVIAENAAASWKQVSSASHWRWATKHGQHDAVPAASEAKYGGGRTHTPLDVFNRVAHLVAQYRRMQTSACLQMAVKSYMLDGQPWICVGVASCREGDASVFSLQGTSLLYFTQQEIDDDDRPGHQAIQVATMSQALHMIEMLRVALGIEEVTLGSRNREMNRDLCADLPNYLASSPKNRPKPYGGARMATADHERQLR